MSHSSLYLVDEKGDVHHEKDYANGHGYAIPCWNYLAEKYLRKPGEDDNNFWIRWWLNEKCQGIWDLKKDARLERWEWICLLASFDYAMVKQENFEETAEAFTRMDLEHGKCHPTHVCHYLIMAFDLRRLAKSPAVKGACWIATSVGENLWEIYDECTCPSCGTVHQPDEGRPYNVNKDTRHFYVFDAKYPRQPEPVVKG